MAMTLLAIIFLVLFLFWKLFWAISKPIFIFIYDGIVDMLTMTGMSQKAARAILSLIAIVFILVIVF